MAELRQVSRFKILAQGTGLEGFGRLGVHADSFKLQVEVHVSCRSCVTVLSKQLWHRKLAACTGDGGRGIHDGRIRCQGRIRLLVLGGPGHPESGALVCWGSLLFEETCLEKCQAPKRPRPLRPPPPAPRPARPVSVEGKAAKKVTEWLLKAGHDRRMREKSTGHARAEEPVLDVEVALT